MELAEKSDEEVEQSEFGHLLTWHKDIRRRQSRGFQFEPISLEAIDIYERRFLARVGIEMDAFDWEMLFQIDDIWQSCAQPAAENDNPGGKTPRRGR